MSDPQVVGRALPRLDARAKVKGEYMFGMDFTVPGMLHGAILRSPHPHARIMKVDTSGAERMPGVIAILTGQDLPGMMMPGVVWDQPPLARDRVLYTGEPVALVAATTLEIAEEAAQRIQVEYEPLPVITDAEAAMQPGAPLLHAQWASYKAEDEVVREGNICCHSSLNCGEVGQGFADSDFVFESEFSTESVHQSHVEPRVAIGTVDAAGRVTVFSNTQLPYWVRTNVAHVLGVDEHQVNISLTGIGGGFGSKLYPQIEPFVALLARKSGRPVRIVVPLEDELRAGLSRHPSKIHIKTGVKKDGTLVALEARIVLDTGAYAGSGPEIASVCLLVLAGPYRIPNVKVDAYAVHTNKTNFGAYRGPGGPQSIFALESHMDVVAGKLGLDPLDFRLRNVLQDGDQAANGQILRGVGLRECLEKAAAAVEWEKPAGPNRGKGLACGWWTTTGGPSGARVKLAAGGKIVATVGTQEIGTGAIMGGVPQVIAEAMHVSLEDVELIVADTQDGPFDFGSQGSRTLFNVGRVAQLACAELAKKIKDLAEKMLEVPAAELELSDSTVVVKEAPEQRISYAALAAIDTNGTLQAGADASPTPEVYDKSRLVSCLYPAFHYPSFHCHAAEVQIDPGTGQVTVLRYAAAHDIGFAVNPTLVAGQIHGGVAQGIGMGLMEELIYQDGHVLNGNWTDYKLPTIADIPEVDAIIVEHPVEGGPWGAKGLGESPVIHPPAALANAISRAAGIRVTSLPITAEKIAKGLRQG